MEYRTLGADEHEELLSLLDGWDVGDGWRPAEFFRRHLEDDPSFEDRNVHVALDAGRIVSCVQVFPRPIHVAGEVIPMGGIGTVFSHRRVRRQGLGEALLARAAADMTRRGMLLSLLFAGRPRWYAKLGWIPARAQSALLRSRSGGGSQSARGPSDSPPGVRDFDPERDAADIRGIHARYSGRLCGPVARDATLWQASLANAGNPDERFRVVCEPGGAAIAYWRTTVLSGFRVLLELGYRLADEGAACDRLCAALAAEVGDVLAAPSLHFDAGLRAGLVERDVGIQELDDRSAMWRILDPPALASRLGLPETSDADLLARLFPPGRSVYWQADRF